MKNTVPPFSCELTIAKFMLVGPIHVNALSKWI